MAKDRQTVTATFTVEVPTDMALEVFDWLEGYMRKISRGCKDRGFINTTSMVSTDAQITTRPANYGRINKHG